MATYYEVLGVGPAATSEEVRTAYRDRARVLHPDRAGADGGGSARAMQDLNEAFRVLRDPQRRADYDRRLAGPVAGSNGGSRPVGWDDDYGQVYGTSHRAEPQDVAASIVRSLPWIGVLFVLAVVFVFTAYASSDGDGDREIPLSDLHGRCVQVQQGVGVVVARCDGPNEGRVDAIGARASHCPSGTTVLPVGGNGPWLCLRPATDG